MKLALQSATLLAAAAACLLVCCLAATDDKFYDLLGVSRQATVREIRKAFKKLALNLHPDKNPDDPTAHEKFLEINRAYEVLKDEDMRKKYDMYGEEGLKEDGPSGGHYQSWNFYNQDFGIYDDDPEIITLSKSDYEQSVENTEDVWFVNFYSPQCSHCHELAPTWRELARELEGVIRIGAVNCEDDWMLCRQLGIRSYPSLLIFPSKEKYHGSRTTKALVQHALKQVRAQVVEMWSGNFHSIMADEEKAGRPWLISFCGEGGDCLLHGTATKLSAMLQDLANVGEIDCHSNEELCKTLGVDYGTFFFEANSVKKGKGLPISSLDAKDIAFTVLGQLPDVTFLDQASFEKARQNLESNADQPWLIHFVQGESSDLELRKLPALLDQINVGRVDCSVMKTICKDMHIHQFPTFALLKPNKGGHEIHHGRPTAHDIAAFAKDSARTLVEVLGPRDFPGRIVDSQDPWFVDFFAPWCPPCMRLLPEFRKASKQMGGQIHFGTVDCTIHRNLCEKYNIHSYPTTIFYNQSVPHEFHGHHSVQALIEFLEDTLQPPVQNLNAESFKRLVSNKKSDEIWLVDYFAPWCGPCQQLAPEWRRLAKMMADIQSVKVAQVDCQANKNLCSQQNVRSYPTIRLYPTGQTGTSKFFMYEGWFRDAPSLRAWIFEYLPSKAIHLTWNNFKQEVLTNTEAWIIDFYTPWCGHCQVFAPEFERVAQQVEGRVNAAKVDCDKEPHLCQEAGVHAYPTVRFYAGSKGGHRQSVYGEEINSQDADYIIKFLNKRVPPKKKTRKDEL